MKKTVKGKSVAETIEAESARLDELTRLREVQNRPKGYAEYLSSALGEANEAYVRARQDAEIDLAKSASGYGTGGERLLRSGLGTSGYADYLKADAERRYASAKKKAEADYADAREAGGKSYEKYLSQHEANEDEILRKALRRMTSDGIESYTEGYRYAVAEGLSGDRAELFARMCDAYGGGRKGGIGGDERISILREIMQNGLDYESAYLYARAVGASGTTAKKIADYAASIRGELGGLLGEN